jgi:hypothetical protein
MAPKDKENSQNNTITRDFNVTLNNKGKWGGCISRDPLRERMEDLMVELDLVNINYFKGKFTWSNRRLKACSRPHHYVSRSIPYLE